MEKSEIKTVLENMKLDVSFQFVPFSQSRNAGEKNLSLNYRADVFHTGKKLFTTDYFMGIGHAPSYKRGGMSVDENNAVKFEVENGISRFDKKPVLPDVIDFFFCVFADCDVLNYSDFEDFAGNMGYDKGSRSAEKIYRNCIEQALKLKNAIGETGFAQLLESYQDY